MTRKDFILIARAIAEVRKFYPTDHSLWRDLSIVFAAELGAGNDRFDRDRFLKACGEQP